MSTEMQSWRRLLFIATKPDFVLSVTAHIAAKRETVGKSFQEEAPQKEREKEKEQK